MCVSVCDVYAHTVVYHKVIVNMCVCVCVCFIVNMCVCVCVVSRVHRRLHADVALCQTDAELAAGQFL